MTRKESAMGFEDIGAQTKLKEQHLWEPTTNESDEPDDEPGDDSC